MSVVRESSAEGDDGDGKRPVGEIEARSRETELAEVPAEGTAEDAAEALGQMNRMHPSDRSCLREGDRSAAVGLHEVTGRDQPGIAIAAGTVGFLAGHR